VGMTRARKRLYLSRSKNRSSYGERRSSPPSPFLASIPSELLAVQDLDPGRRPGFPARMAARFVAESFGGEEHPAQLDLPLLSATPAAKGQPSFSLGDPVEHETLGRGIVRKVTVEGEKEKIIVEFQGGRIRKLMAQVAPIRKLPKKPAK